MKTSKFHSQSWIKKHLSPDEQKNLDQFNRTRSDHPSATKRGKSIIKTARNSMMIAAFAVGFSASNATTVRAEAGHAVSAPALFNEANAAQRAGHLGPAILGYERASILAPGDPAIAQNLRMAREKAGVTVSAMPAWQRPAYWLSFNGLSALASICLFLYGLNFFGRQHIPANLRGVARSAAHSFVVIALLATSAIVLRWPELDRAIIVGAHSSARIAPAADAATAFDLKPGEIINAGNTYGNYVRIHTADGRGGWVAASEVEKIYPTTS